MTLMGGCERVEIRQEGWFRFTVWRGDRYFGMRRLYLSALFLAAGAEQIVNDEARR